MLSALAPKRAAASAPPHFSTPLYHTVPRLGTIPAPNLLSGNNSLSSVHFRISRPMGRRGPPSGRLRRPAAAYEGLRPSALRVPPPPFPSGPKFSLPARPCGPAAACGRAAPCYDIPIPYFNLAPQGKYPCPGGDIFLLHAKSSPYRGAFLYLIQYYRSSSVMPKGGRNCIINCSASGSSISWIACSRVS